MIFPSGGDCAPGLDPTQRTLILVHGMTSSVEGAFGTTIANLVASKQSKWPDSMAKFWGLTIIGRKGLDSSGQQLGTFLDCLASKGFNNVDIEAHSEGVPVALAAAGHSTLSLNHMVLLGGPINGTPIANAQSVLNTAFGSSLLRFDCVGGARLSDALRGAFAEGMRPDSPQLTLIKSNFNNRTQNPNVLAVGGTQKPFSISGLVLNLAQGRIFDITDAVVPISSALPDSGLRGITWAAGFPVSHTELTCDPGVIQAVGVHVRATPTPTPSPTATPAGCCLGCALANRCADPCCQAGTCCN